MPALPIGDRFDADAIIDAIRGSQLGVVIGAGCQMPYHVSMAGASDTRRPTDLGSCGSRRTALGFRSAVDEMFGDEGVRAVRAHLPHDADVAFFDARSVADKWIAERHLLAFMDAVLAGPCGRNRMKFTEWSRLQITRGFGRVRAATIRVGTPELLTSRAAASWREEHTRGELVSINSPGRAVLTLTEHEYVSHPLAPTLLTESLRTVIGMSYFAKDVRGTFELVGGPKLAMTFTWG